jgi:CDP-diacylglycerol--glycerol-3-phosphate 3-phosphatidyltransferase
LTKDNQIVAARLTLPNFLSGFRIVAAPILIYLAWEGQPNLFLILLAVCLLSDAIDGTIARWQKCTSKFGAKLDSWGDFAIYMSVPLCAWWLWPDVLKDEAFFAFLVIGSFTAPFLVGVIKFGRLPAYHTWSAKAGAVFISVSAFLLFIMGIAWPFRCAAIFLALSASEEIAITLLLSEWRCNVSSFWHARLHINENRKSSR